MKKLKKKYFKSVSRSIKINSHHDKVWEIISKQGNLELCHPFCESNPVEQWPGSKSIDYVNYYNGLKYQRNFTSWVEGIGYDLLIGKVNGRKSKVLWRINKIDNSSSELKITIYPHDIKRYSNFLKPIIYLLFIKPNLQKYLSSVLKGFQWYLVHGEPVKKNQFGLHKWFSI